MYELQHHEMRLATTHPSGAEEWYCPICGQQLIMDWQPQYRLTVLELGNEFALHSDGAGGLLMPPPRAAHVEEPALTDELRLAPWLEWLESVDFDAWWHRDLADLV